MVHVGKTTLKGLIIVNHTSFFCVMSETYTKIKTSSFFQMYTDFECRGLKKVRNILSVPVWLSY